MPDQLTVRRLPRHGAGTRSLGSGFGAPEPIRPATVAGATVRRVAGTTAESPVLGGQRVRRPATASGPATPTSWTSARPSGGAPARPGTPTPSALTGPGAQNLTGPATAGSLAAAAAATSATSWASARPAGLSAGPLAPTAPAGSAAAGPVIGGLGQRSGNRPLALGALAAAPPDSDAASAPALTVAPPPVSLRPAGPRVPQVAGGQVAGGQVAGGQVATATTDAGPQSTLFAAAAGLFESAAARSAAGRSASNAGPAAPGSAFAAPGFAAPAWAAPGEFSPPSSPGGWFAQGGPQMAEEGALVRRTGGRSLPSEPDSDPFAAGGSAVSRATGPQLEEFVDLVVDRIEQRVIDELERRGRRPGGF